MSNNTVKKNILIVTSTFPRWRNDTDPPFIFELSRRLVKLGFNVDVLAPHVLSSARNEIMDGVKVFRYVYFFPRFEHLAYSGGIMANLRKNKFLYLLIPFFLISQFIAIYRKIKSKQYDVIHAHWIIPQGLLCVMIGIFYRGEMPLILCTSHGSDLFLLRSKILTLLKKWTIRKLGKLIVVSNYMHKHCLHLGVDKENLLVIPMGIDLENVFKPADDIKKKTQNIIFVGRLVKNKGVSFLLDAIDKMVINYPEIKLIIIGDGPERYALEKKIKLLNIEKHVEFHGALHHSKLPGFYNKAAIAVMPSTREEGLGLTIIEAMGCGCTVVASALGSIREIIDNGTNGLLVVPGNHKEISDAITYLLEHDKERIRMSQNGRQSVIEKYDWEIISRKYQNIYLEHS